MPLGISVTDLEIEEAIREAWAVLSAGSAVSPSARRLAAALPAVTGGTQTRSYVATATNTSLSGAVGEASISLGFQGDRLYG